MSKYSLSFNKHDAAEAYRKIEKLETKLGLTLDWKKIKRQNGDNVALIINILERDAAKLEKVSQ